MLIYVVDDEETIRKTLTIALKRELYDVKAFSNGIEAYDSLQSEHPDLIVLDWDMPVMDGITFLEKIRAEENEVPVIFLTIHDNEMDRIDALEKGADDYLEKPYSLKELTTRIKVVLRRYHRAVEAAAKDETISNGEIELNLTSYTATLQGKPVDFTVTEFRILEAFLRNPEMVFSREKLLEISFPEDSYAFDRAVDSHIKRLRKKIGTEKIETVYGVGYKFGK
ncbi:MAG: response regulator transcription factor [Treponema sp.]|nr:response regulator transcription factor [Candidatus Treponema equifaecale]